MSSGLLDTNVFIHAYASDNHTDECRRFLLALERGEIAAVLEPPVVHELTYTLPRYLKQLTRRNVADYLIRAIEWPGVEADKAQLVEALTRWRDTPGLPFVDAYLSTLALRSDCVVYTKDATHFRGQGVRVPVTLPG